MKKKVLIPTKLDKVARELLEKNGNYTVVQEEKTELAVLAKQHADAHALIVRSEKVTKEIIDALPQLKVVMRAGSGYNTIDTKYARKKGIDVMTTPGANANAVKVANSEKFVLPVTGGTGTLMFTMGGVLLIGAAGVLLVLTKKNRQSAK